ncbi:hypothetical protein D3C87_1500410 [compost metagenome]
MHQRDGAEGHEDVLAEEQADVVGSGAEGQHALAHRLGQVPEAVLGRALGHRGQQRTHHLRMPAQAGQPHGGGQLAHGEVDDQQAANRGRGDARDPRLRVLPQAVALKQADHGQRQQDDQRQVACLDEGRADCGEDLHQRHGSGQPRDDGGKRHHQHGIEPQDKADDDDADPEQGPKIDSRFHG